MVRHLAPRLANVALFAIFTFSAVSAARADGLAPDLSDRLRAAGAGDLMEVIVHVRGGADAASLKSAGTDKATMLTTLRSRAATSQAGVRALVQDLARRGEVFEFESFWGFNGLYVAGTPSAVQAIAAHPDVETVTYNEVHSLPPTPIVALPKAASDSLALSNVPQVWNQLGFTGAGVLVANMDSGVDGTHPALAPKWRGGANSWFDSVLGTPTPTDENGHGTNTMGIMVAGDGDAGADPEDVGVAYNATWIATRIFDASGSGGSNAVIHAGYQWLMDPDGDPLTDDLPDVVNNSWGFSGTGCNLEFQADLQNIEALGIISVFSAGNSGPGAGSYNSPANNGYNISAGAVDNATGIASFSSRGPNPCTGAIGPDVVAQGVNNRSTRAAFEGGGYESGLNGTSFSAPTTAGIVALMKEANANLSRESAQEILEATAIDLGDPGKDNNYGSGLVDALAAVSNVLNPTPSISLKAFAVDDIDAGCSENGRAEPGESLIMGVILRNGGLADATGVAATLTTSDPTVTITQASANYGDMVPGAEVLSPTAFAFDVSLLKQQFSSIAFTLEVSANEGNWQVPINVPVGGDGYVADDTVAFDWIDAQGGTAHALADDDSVEVPIGFDFEFFGTIYSSVWVDSNGFIAFDGTGTGGITGVNPNPTIPTAAAPNAVAAPFWDDLNPSIGGLVNTLVTGTAPDRRFVAQWTGVTQFNLPAGETVAFQVVLKEGGEISFNYADTTFGSGTYDFGASATVGIEDAAGTEGLLYSYDTPSLSDFSSIRIYQQECIGNPCTDADGDGYAVEGGVCGEIDCDDTNADVNPGAAEVPGNGIDDDCDPATPDAPGGCAPVRGASPVPLGALAFHALAVAALATRKFTKKGG
ncbi:MAG: S8 family serine peptidase [Myxococcales bacterium]|nr:S8 family serine peptidase [Myxococcales bacterium]